MLNNSYLSQCNSEKTFYSTACAVCMKATCNIRRCSKCKTVPYCGKEHQVQDWPSHKKLCNVIQDTNARIRLPCRNFQEWSEYRVALRMAWQETLQRPLERFEMLMTMFPRACVVCYSKQNLYDCKKCLNVAYCSEQHEREYSSVHTVFCKDLKIGLLVEQYLHHYGMSKVKFEVPDNELKPPVNTFDMVQYIKYNNILEEMDTYLTKEDKLITADILKTGLIASGLSILYGLQLMKIDKSRVVIHIVGPSFLEFSTKWNVVTDILRYWLNITLVSYYLIGPEVNEYEFQDVKIENYYEVRYFGHYYHEIVNNIQKPDLVVAFNCGFHEFELDEQDTWKCTIPLLLKHPHVPLLMTSYTELEMAKDKQKVLNLDMQFDIIIDERNPFAFLKPVRDWSSDTTPVFYHNNYIFIVERIL